MATQVDRDNVLVSRTGQPLAGRHDGIGCVVDSTDGTVHKGLVALSNGSIAKTLDHSLMCEVFEDFLGPVDLPTTGDTLVNVSSPWFVKDTSAAGSPTKALVADADNGQYALAFSATSEAQILTLFFNDELNIDSDQGPAVIFRLALDAQFAAGTILVFGLGSAQNDTADSVANHAWFRIEGANLNLLTESDDGTTDVDDQDTGVDLVAATFYEFKVSANKADGASISDVKFFYRSTLGGDWTALNTATTFAIAADTAIQPFLQLQKSTGTATDGIKIDYAHAYWERN